MIRLIGAAVLASLIATSVSLVAFADDPGSRSLHATVTVVSAVTIELRLRDAQIHTGETTEAVVTVNNSTGGTLPSMTIALRADEAGLRIVEGKHRVIPDLTSGQTAIVTWPVCGRKPGNYILIAAIQSEGKERREWPGEPESRAVLLTVTGGKGSC